jgi:hypothetical protein
MSLSFFDNTDLASLPAFATSLAIGLLMGLERERSPAANAGLRTFALTAMWGTLSAMLAELTHMPSLIGFALAGVGIAITSSYFLMRPQNRDPGKGAQAGVSGRAAFPLQPHQQADCQAGGKCRQRGQIGIVEKRQAHRHDPRLLVLSFHCRQRGWRYH